MADWSALGKSLVMLGGGIALVGAIVWMVGRVPFLGQLPGDVTIRRGNWSCHFPIVTSIVLSIVLTILLNLIAKLINR